jgi:putative FmdB family regulatory protein
MPLYEFKCQKCRIIHERTYQINKCPRKVKCEDCGGTAKKIISVGHGGVFCDSVTDVKWLPSALKVLQPDGERPIQSRGEYRRYLRERELVCKG